MKFSPLCKVLATVGGMVVLLSNLANPPNGRTGAPFDSTCNTSGCHLPMNASFDGTVSISGLPTVIQPSTNYSITLTVNVSAGSPTRAGFQLVAVQGNNTNAGDLQASGDAGTEISGGREYVEHRGGKVFSGGSASWTFTWISPASSNGNIVNFYFTANLANGSTNQNDKIIWGSDSYDFAGAVPLTVNITNVTNVTCFGGNNGSATAVPTGGTPPYSYNWTGGETTATAVQLTAGVKSVTVTDNGGQQQIKTVTITQPPVINVATSVQGQVTCTANAVITATPSGGVGNFSYSWPDGSSGNTFTATAPGSYTVTVTDGNACTKTASATVIGNTTPPTAAATGGVLTCANTSVELNAMTNASSASFQWSGPGNFSSTLQNPTTSTGGTYTVIITNNTTGCTNSATATVSGSTTPPTASAQGGSLNCINTSVQISASTNAGAAGTFSWTGPGGFTSNLQNPTVGTAGNYVVVVTNSTNGCTSSATAVVAQNTDLPGASASASGSLTCVVSAVNLTGSAVYPNSIFNWTGPNGFTSSLQNPTGITVAGNYVLTTTHPVSGCTSTATAVVSQNTAVPNLSIAGGGTLTCSVASIQICGSSTTPNTTFAWTGPNGFSSQQACISATQPGSYNLVVSNPANGCTAAQATTVSQDIVPPGASATGGTLTCTATSISLSGNATANGSTFAWAGPNNFVSTQQNPSVSTAGTYILTATGTNGCTSSATTTVSENTTPPTAAIAAPSNLNCNQNQLTLDATASSQGANFSYNWTTTGGNILSGGNSTTPVVNQAGIYIFQILNSQNGCTASASTTVNQSPAVSLAATSQNVACFGQSNGTASATASGGVGNLNYLWSNGATTASISNLSAGTYSVSVADTEGCGQSASVTISQPNLLVANAVATPESAAGANNGTATASPTGGSPNYNYLWSNGATTAQITGLAPGVYIVTVGDANGCTAVQTVTVNAFGCTVAISTNSQNVTCNGQANGSATVNITAANQPVAILWTTASGTPVGFTATVSNLAPGNYLVGVLDAANCPAAGSVTISEPPVLAANATSTNESAVGANDGTATASPSGGTSPYSFLWSNGATSQSLTNLAPGVYTVSVTDVNSCQSTQSVSVSAFDCALNLNVTATGVSCFGTNDATATVSVSGGTSPFTYLWSNGQTTATATGLDGSLVSVTVTDAAGCVATGQPNLIVIPPPLVFQNISVQQNVCIESQNGAISLEGTGGTPPFSYQWSNGQSTPNLTNLPNGNYILTLTDSKGCTKISQTFQIAATDNVPPTLLCPQNTTACEGNAVVFTAPQATDNCTMPPNSVVQTGGPASGTVLAVGTHVVTFAAKDALGNGSTCSFSIQVNPRPVVKIEKVVDATAGQNNGSISVSVETGSGCTFKWTGPNGFSSTLEDLSNLGEGIYKLEINCDGCITTLEQEVKSTIGTSQVDAFGGVKIYPNPAAVATGELFFQNENDWKLQVQIFDAKGALLEKLPLDAGQTARLDLSKNSLSVGLYTARFVRSDGKFVVKRFSVN